MPCLTVNIGDHNHRKHFSPGSSVREILDSMDLPVRSGCRGDGSCGLCLIQVTSGEVDAPTRNERLMLNHQQTLEQKIRLACQVVPRNDLSIRIINPAPKSNWRSLPLSTASVIREKFIGKSNRAYGAAIDLGTTHISVTLWDVQAGTRIAGLVGANPQMQYGADVISRLLAANESSENVSIMSKAVFTAISEALMDMCSRNCINSKEIRHIAVVGNTPMLALLAEKSPQILLSPGSWNSGTDCTLENAREWVDALNLAPDAVFETIPPLAGFVGSDLLAGVLAGDLTHKKGSLLIDFGTNSEIALWDGKTLWVTSAAGGPAFEGCGISCGMPAESGAIYRVTAKPNFSDVDCRVIDDAEPKGVCGSGIVDLISFLLENRRLDPLGRFSSADAEGFLLMENPPIRLDRKGVDVFQRAKAAIGAGIRILLEKAGMKVSELERVCVCGAFGQYLDIQNAQAVGLLPSCPPGRIELCGNMALSGCERMVLSTGSRPHMQQLRESARILNLAMMTEFDNLFMECLYLQPLNTANL